MINGLNKSIIIAPVIVRVNEITAGEYFFRSGLAITFPLDKKKAAATINKSPALGVII